MADRDDNEEVVSDSRGSDYSHGLLRMYTEYSDVYTNFCHATSKESSMKLCERNYGIRHLRKAAI